LNFLESSGGIGEVCDRGRWVVTDTPEQLETGSHEGGREPCTHKLEIEARARRYLESLGHGHHHEADADPVYALFQVATDCCAQANGYRELYERLRDARGQAEAGPQSAVGS
jgi:hypothetical protein